MAGQDNDQVAVLAWHKNKHRRVQDPDRQLREKESELEQIRVRRQQHEARIKAREQKGLVFDDEATTQAELRFRYSTLHQKFSDKLEGPSSLFLSIYAILRAQTDEHTRVCSLSYPEFLQSTSISDLIYTIERCNEFLDVVVQLSDKDEEAQYWNNAKLSIAGEIRERQHAPYSLLEPKVQQELRSMLKMSKLADVMDMQRMVALQLHYASADDDIDIDYWEEVEKKLPWFYAVVYVREKQDALIASGVPLEEPLLAKAGGEKLSEEDQKTAEAIAAADIDVEQRGSMEDPNAAFDRMVLRERAQETDTNNILEGGSFQTWQPGVAGVLTKPRYFSRIKTAHEWHKYNQMHYDMNNPPPKAIQGYRFLICYPNLPTGVKPAWRLEQDPSATQIDIATADTSNTVLIRFSAPSYKDVVFRIVRREWDATPRNGFKNLYENGILVLSFVFKRNRYRK
ncbi:cactin [Gregarina niphandrodes]|uniref:Splicing factor Cactin n=1 Tax=Gregarina niphandrodes TaxID=110365 RepID=A0A023B8T2_GRENI|nr:cactin [Gregarina niphandrodes]EZG70160.1 cactin [Gregarina niphandrodes]|eukprot:XP_011129979.1 cactin [Gregarina niphandrodes]